MIENNNISTTSDKSLFRKAPLAAALSLLAIGVASPAMAEIALESDSGWKVGFSGHIPVFAVIGDYDEPADEDSFNITTGFNPATLQTNLYAPMQNGIQVSGHFQMNADFAVGDAALNFRSRVAEIAVAGDFGTVNIGKGFGIYGTPAIGDNGSALGVGLISSPDSVAATAGRIGNGYFYANFNPRVMYTSNSFNGLQFKVGIFTPTKLSAADDPSGDAEYNLPRFEGNVVYSADMFSLWTSAFTQDVGSRSGVFDDYTMSGIDFGGSVSLGGLSVRGNYAMTSGTGNGVYAARFDDQEADASQWYVESTYDFGRTTLGASYGEGEDDIGTGENDTDLTMIFARYAATDALTLMVEVQAYGTQTGAGDYNAFIVGSQLTF
jgi:predicted porin